jgi:signal peptidase II
MKKKAIIAILIIFGVLLLDQILKIWVKTNMVMGEEIHIIGNRIMFHFTENPGMAFGMELGGTWGKLALSIFRIIAICGLSYYLYRIIKSGENLFYIVCIALVIAGATGNLIDSAFYGLIFNDSYGQVATMFPAGGGYESFLYGNVVDMFYCPVIDSYYPDWVPFVGGDRLLFFRPVFNVADSAITVSVFIMIVFYRKVFRKNIDVTGDAHKATEAQESSAIE